MLLPQYFHRIRRLIGACALLLTMGCSSQTAAPVPSASTPPPRDMATNANIDTFVTKHLVLDLAADFDSKTLAGTAELRFERRDPRATEMVLDTRDLQIRKAETATGHGTWTDAAYRLDPATAAFGSALRVVVPPDADRVRVTYTTSPSARGLQWLTPAQTSGKKHPFLFSQAQAIHARSFIPLQDTPGVRATYDATIRAPKELVAVMAAEMKPGEAGSGVFHFHMPQPIARRRVNRLAPLSQMVRRRPSCWPRASRDLSGAARGIGTPCSRSPPS